MAPRRVTLGVMTLPPTAPRPARSSPLPSGARTHRARAGTPPSRDETPHASDAATPPAGPVVPAFDQVLAAHEAELYRYLRRLAPTAEDAADLLQDTCVRAVRAYPRLAADANVRAWLYRIAGNLARDAHRRRRVRAGVGITEPWQAAGDEPPPVAHAGTDTVPMEALGGSAAALAWREGRRRAGDGDPVEHVAAAELRDAVRLALLELSDRQRVAVVRRVLEDRPYRDVAAALGCSDVTARQHVSQGLRRLRTLLAPWMEPER